MYYINITKNTSEIGVEPMITVLETVVLPLNYSLKIIYLGYYKISNSIKSVSAEITKIKINLYITKLGLVTNNLIL